MAKIICSLEVEAGMEYIRDAMKAIVADLQAAERELVEDPRIKEAKASVVVTE